MLVIDLAIDDFSATQRTVRCRGICPGAGDAEADMRAGLSGLEWWTRGKSQSGRVDTLRIGSRDDARFSVSSSPGAFATLAVGRPTMPTHDVAEVMSVAFTIPLVRL